MSNNVTEMNGNSPHSDNLLTFKAKHANQLIFGHLNINSLQNKHGEIHDIMQSNVVDILTLSETKKIQVFPMLYFMFRISLYIYPIETTGVVVFYHMCVPLYPTVTDLTLQ